MQIAYIYAETNDTHTQTGTVLTPGVHDLNLLHNISDAASAPVVITPGPYEK